jgi:tetratricopeptide (TPR) repeat protein
MEYSRTENLVGRREKDELLRRLEANREQLKQAHAAENTDLVLGLREQAFDIISELHGPESRETLVARGQIGLALFESRRFAEAEKLFSDLLSARADLLGHDHEETLSTRGNYAKAVARNGRPNEALLILGRLLAARTRLLGERHESTLATRGMIAHTLLLAGDVQGSINSYETLLEDQIEELGETHPNVAVTLSNLAVIRARTSEPDSIREQEELVNEYATELGDDHPQTLAQKHLLAETYMRTGRHSEGFALIDEVYTRRLATFGELDPGTLAARGLRAQITASLGRIEEACSELLRCVNGWEARGAHNESHALTALAETICVLLRLLGEMEAGSANPARQFENLVIGSTYVRSIERMILQLESAVKGYESTHPLRQFVENTRKYF